MRKDRQNMEMLSREKLLLPTNQAHIKFLTDKEMQKKLKGVDFFASKHIFLSKK